MTEEAKIEFTWGDVGVLLSQSPLAAEQLKNIALHRSMAELQQRIEEMEAALKTCDAGSNDRNPTVDDDQERQAEVTS